MEAIYDRCSIDVVVNFIDSQYQAISGAGIEVQKRTFKFLVELFYLFKNTTNQSKMEKVVQIKHMMNFQRKTSELVARQFEEACFFPEQYKIILESIEDKSLSEEISGRLGIPIESYLQIC